VSECGGEGSGVGHCCRDVCVCCGAVQCSAGWGVAHYTVQYCVVGSGSGVGGSAVQCSVAE
jgi:hypothetical protein